MGLPAILDIFKKCDIIPLFREVRVPKDPHSQQAADEFVGQINEAIEELKKELGKDFRGTIRVNLSIVPFDLDKENVYRHIMK